MKSSFEFALAIIAYCDQLNALRKFELSRQLFRSGTAIHALIREAQCPESKADFVHKLKISQKEASETEGWLLLCRHSEGYPDPAALLEQLLPIRRMLASSISTAKNRIARIAGKLATIFTAWL